VPLQQRDLPLTIIIQLNARD